MVLNQFDYFWQLLLHGPWCLTNLINFKNLIQKFHNSLCAKHINLCKLSGENVYKILKGNNTPLKTI